MNKINREDLHNISRHSNLTEHQLAALLNNEVYNKAPAWSKFLRLFFMALGVGFSIAGILFFFAYNWADLHKFAKIGLLQALLSAMLLVVVFSKLKTDFKNMVLTGACVLVGVLYAVFGQIYQTGADAYDFFMAWSLSILIWVVVGNFHVLWLLFSVLVNTTLILYFEQSNHQLSDPSLFTLFFVLNAVFLLFFMWGSKKFLHLNAPNWLLYVLVLAVLGFGTFGVIEGIYSEKEPMFIVLLLLVVSTYAAGIYYGYTSKNSFYLSVIPTSIIIILTAWFLRLSDDGGMFFFVSLFVIASVTVVIKTLMDLQKKWKNE